MHILYDCVALFEKKKKNWKQLISRGVPKQTTP